MIHLASALALPVLPLLTMLAAGTPVTIDDFTSVAPASWKEQPPRPMRFKTFTIPKVAADKFDGEVVIFFFGAGQGGDPQANLDRWKGMFDPPAGKKPEDVSKTETMKVNGVDVTVLEVKGTYKFKASPMAPGEPELRPDHHMIAVIFASANGPYFIRFVGPEKTVAKNKKDFDRWLKGFKQKKS
jgi:hypothetical protein